MIKKYTKIQGNQAGAVSMIVAILIMLLLTLIVLKMSQDANVERRQALDRQLSDQAFYNAESGINDAAKFLAENPTADEDHLNDCNFNPVPTQPAPAGNIDADGNNKYTCVLYNKAPLTLVYDDVGVADSKVIPIEPLDAAGNPTSISSIKISWDDKGDQNNVSGCTFEAGTAVALPTSMPPNCIGGVRVDLIPAAFDRDQLNEATRSAFLLPGSSSGANGAMTFPGTYPEWQGAIGVARCDEALPRRKCSITLNNILPRFTLRIKSLYQGTDIYIEDANAVTPVRFDNAQIMIDSTGRSSDILRRIQVRLPAQPQYHQAEFGIQSKDSICKILEVKDGSVAPSTTHTSATATDCPL